MSLNFLILEPNPFVARDLSEIVMASAPGSVVTVCETQEAALAALEKIDDLTAAFVNARPADIQKSGLAEKIVQCSGHVLIIRDEDRYETSDHFNCTFVEMPFTTDSISEIIQNLCKISAE
ncbi:hypothetical protein [Parasulfitobacter algicola]|uniref:Response regulatory domain-containing protein n=1 Tax=Parasulfitobacter algicola TaxID=2614809 RepID=A0ABX2IUP9_9RHOB|nr:hypothetical protein [Sulfitobacter algicola]NSX54006.1 hypothetical protein [Sulfitobacter algicola]